MLTILVEILMSAFIANFKASEHPVISNVVRGCIIFVCVFIFCIYTDISQKRGISIFFALWVSALISVAIIVLLVLIDKFSSLFDNEK